MINEKQIKLSSSSLNLFLECPACFWLEKNKNIKRPVEYPYLFNLELDRILKQEFDYHRKTNDLPSVLSENKIKAKLFENQKMLNQWRNKSIGLNYFDEKLGVVIFGTIDDLLEFPDNKFSPLDYKSTELKIEKIYDRFQLQMDVYSFLLEKNGFSVNKKAFLVFYTINSQKGFLDKIPFKKEILQIKTNTSDVYDIFKDAVLLLKSKDVPEHSRDCKFYNWLKRL